MPSGLEQARLHRSHRYQTQDCLGVQFTTNKNCLKENCISYSLHKREREMNALLKMSFCMVHFLCLVVSVWPNSGFKNNPVCIFKVYVILKSDAFHLISSKYGSWTCCAVVVVVRYIMSFLLQGPKYLPGFFQILFISTCTC